MYYTAGDDDDDVHATQPLDRRLDEMVGEKNAGYQAEESESGLEGERKEGEEGKEE